MSTSTARTLPTTGEELATPATLAGLLDTLTARGVRLSLAADRRHFATEAPRGALTSELREAIAAHRGALLAALTATPAPTREGIHVCVWGKPHMAHWRYSERERRLVCLACYPELARETSPRIEAPTSAHEERELLVTDRRREWIAKARRELATWAHAHNWPLLAIGHSANNSARYRLPYKHVSAGASAWALFVAYASGPDLAAAYRAAGLDRQTRPAMSAAPRSGQEGPQEASAQDGEELAGAGAGAVLTVDDAGAYLCRGLAAPERLAYTAADVATIAGMVRYGEAHGAANIWLDPRSAIRERMAGDPAAFLADAAAVGVRADASRGISQIYTAHVASEARPRRHTVILTLPDPAGNHANWPHGAAGQALALAYAGEALAWPFRGLPHYVGRRLILKHNATRGWYERPAASYASLAANVPALGEAIRRRRDMAPDLVWRRALTAGEEAQAAAGELFAHGLDKASCYLSMCSSVDLPIGAPRWIEGARLEKRPGEGTPAALWHVTITYGASAYTGRELPAICGEGDVWLWTPALRVALDMGYQVTAWHGAVMWPEQHRILNTWKQRLWSALLALRDASRYPDASARELAGQLVKAVYRQTIGMFGYDRPRPAGSSAARELQRDASAGAAIAGEEGEEREALARWTRPEWQALIISEAAARMVRHIEKCRAAGLAPLLAHTDSLAFLSLASDREEFASALRAAGLALDPDTCGAFIPEYLWALADADIRAALASPKHQQSVHGHMLPSVRA